MWCIFVIRVCEFDDFFFFFCCMFFLEWFNNLVLGICRCSANVWTCLHLKIICLQKLPRKKRRKVKASEDLTLALIALFLVKHFHLKVDNFSSDAQEKERSTRADWSTIHSCYWPFPFWRVSWGWDSAVQRWVSICYFY